jgi:hypothetical protein
MKPLFLSLASLFIFTCFCRAQDSLHTTTPNPSFEKNKFLMPDKNSKEFLEGKHNKLNTTGWILLGTGVALGVTGIIIYDHANKAGDWGASDNLFGGVFLMIAGSALTIASVPVFIKAGYYKRKAMNMSANLRFEPYQSGVAIKQYPAIGLKISL